jgi:hypothetical protein
MLSVSNELLNSPKYRQMQAEGNAEQGSVISVRNSFSSNTQ